MPSRLLLRWTLAALLLAAGPTAALDGPRIAAVRPLPDRPYLVVDVEYPRTGAELAFTFEADGRAIPSRALGGGSDPRSIQKTYLVFPGAICRSLVARWGDRPRDRTAPMSPLWKAPALALLLDRLDDREALLEPADLEFQVFPPATAQFFQDGSRLPPTRVEATGPGERLRVSPRWRPGLNTVRMVVTGSGGKAERTFTFVLLQDGGLAPGDYARLVYGDVGSRSGPFYRVHVDGDAVAIAGDGIENVLSADNGWILESPVHMAKIEAKAAGEATLRIGVKESFLQGEYKQKAEHRIRVGAGGAEEGSSGLRHDPIEDDPRYKEVFARVDAEVDALLANHPLRGEMGFCHIAWKVKRQLLKEKYGIDWRAPNEMNPQVIFD